MLRLLIRQSLMRPHRHNGTATVSRQGTLNRMIPLNSAFRNFILYVVWLSAVNPVSMVPLADHTMEYSQKWCDIKRNPHLTSPSDNLKREGKTHIPRNFLAFTTTRDHFVKTYSSTIQKHKTTSRSPKPQVF
jgi:hypothetical protein